MRLGGGAGKRGSSCSEITPTLHLQKSFFVLIKDLTRCFQCCNALESSVLAASWLILKILMTSLLDFYPL